jgi:riboflavin kinase/FMN adenylyltransferase
VVVGHDHRFGQGRKGDVSLLGELLGPRRIGLEIVPEFLLLGAPVRSTRIREYLLLGHVRRAAELLGRHYGLTGRVITGTGTGRLLGFPTINLQVEEPEKLVPADGVYAALADILGKARPAVLNIGHRPTFQGEKRSIEAHLFDCEFRSPPRSATVRFVQRLRPERRFPNPQALSDQIAQDIAEARRMLPN